MDAPIARVKAASEHLEGSEPGWRAGYCHIERRTGMTKSPTEVRSEQDLRDKRSGYERRAVRFRLERTAEEGGQDISDGGTVWRG